MTGEATDSAQRVAISGSSSSAGNNGQGIDYNHPLFLSPTDVSGISIISFQLQDIENYNLWNRSIKLALLGRNKLGLVDVMKSLLSGIAFASNASSVWSDLLKALWDEFEVFVPPPCYNCEKSRGFVAHMNRQKLYQFLMGLNDTYHQARSQILMIDPLPTINQAYAMIVGDESQKAVVIGINNLGLY
ncbi:uncharacterized protein LOC129883737 [Solanum dulcamara]|uniref:uncharacterized protein LOC129883737 n=1 Tax=Solanum dulcamara TaxID=45834 RepID=UPI002485ED4E|nr:uncharacterized protein LOC129883737 [Solanum dulcamara]